MHTMSERCFNHGSDMAVVIGILDEDVWQSRTDNVVHVDPARRSLTWIPRDLWCECVGDRINRAYKLGGPELLLAACREHGFAAQHAIVVRRGATESFLSGLSVTVPVAQTEEYWYPAYPGARVQDSRRRVIFRAPEETLTGIRLHEWIGARTSVNRDRTDLDRLARQQVFIRRLLEEQVEFSSILDDTDRLRISDPKAIEVLARVRPDWDFSTFDRVHRAEVDGKQALVSTVSRRGRWISLTRAMKPKRILSAVRRFFSRLGSTTR
jgi:hypothetical protein